MAGKDIIAIIEPGDHTKQGDLSEVKKCLNGQSARQEPNDSFGRSAVKLQKSLHVFLEVAGNDRQLGG